MTSAAKTLVPSDPKRFTAFVSYFKRYLGVWSAGAAALPIPVAKLGLIPVYQALSGSFATYVSLFCFLMLGYIFYCRHAIARWMFKRLKRRHGKGRRFIAVLPLLLIVASLASAIAYQLVLHNSVAQVAYSYSLQGRNADARQILQGATEDEIWYGVPLLVCYLGIFVCAESAFLLMAIREYLQDILKLQDAEIIELVR